MTAIRHYLQSEPPSVRRYTAETGERWEPQSRKWIAECAHEEACIVTGDKLASEAEARFFISTRIFAK